MRTQQITSLSNARVKQWVQLKERKYRNKEGLFIAEGIHLVQEALRSKAKVHSIVYDMELGLPSELQEWAHNGLDVEWIEVNDAIIRKCTDTETPQPVFAIIQKPGADYRLLLEANKPLVIVVDGVQDPGNLGTIIRSADAVGATGVVIGKGSVDLYNSKTVRSTMGSLFHLPIVEADLTTLLPEVKGQGIHVVSTSLQASHTCYSYDFTQPTWFVVGNEGKGVSSEVSLLVEDHILIPMKGQAESLNVAMATTVMLYEALRQREFAL